MFNAALNAARRIDSELVTTISLSSGMSPEKTDGSRANPSPISPRVGSSYGKLGMFILVISSV